jgi:TRAP-type C4-dicarboxylate transport system substrate-binding protein
MLSSLSSNNIQAALLTSFGLSEIIPEVMNLSVPFNIRNDSELDAVLAEVLPILDDRARQTNFVVVTWSRAGWVNIFSREQVLVPGDLRRMRVSTSAEQENLNAVFRGMGFTLVEAEITEIGTMLANNMINAIYQSPAAVAPLGMHRQLTNMLDMPVAPFLGGIVMNRATWDRLGADRQRAIQDVTRRIAAEFDAAMPRTVSNAVSTMQRDGLRINTPTPQQQAQWQNETARAMPSLLGGTFDRAMHDRITNILQRHRART